MRQNRMPINCDHNCFHSGMGRLARDIRSIRFVLVCDSCGAEVREVHVEDYAPNPDRQTFDTGQGWARPA
jgi:hypothetical protein